MQVSNYFHKTLKLKLLEDLIFFFFFFFLPINIQRFLCYFSCVSCLYCMGHNKEEMLHKTVLHQFP